MPFSGQRELRGGVRGKHYKSYQAGTNLALLAADVRAAFPTDEAVNKALRGLMKKKSARCIWLDRLIRCTLGHPRPVSEDRNCAGSYARPACSSSR
jgi:hypothetical protein